MLLAVALVQLGAVTHAIWNVLVARVEDGGRLYVWVYSLMSLLLLGPVVLVLAVVQHWSVPGVLLAASAVSGLLHTAYALALQWAYTATDLNVAYPVSRGAGPLIVVVVAVAFLGEHLGWLGWSGLVTITAGIVVVSAGSRRAAGEERRASGVWSGLLVAATIAAYTLWDDRAMSAWGLDPIAYYTGTALLQLVALTVLSARQLPAAPDVVRRHWRSAAVVGVLVPVSYVLVLVAMTMAPVSLVAPLRSTSIALGSLAGWWLLHEPHGRRRLLGAGIVVAGVTLMSIGST